MKPLLDADHPAFRPLWVRALVVGLAGGWAVFEFVAGSVAWGMLFAAIAAYAAWKLFIRFDPPRGADPD